MIEKLLYVSFGGAIGAVLRHSMISISHRLINSAIPIGTIAVNVVGSLAIGFLWGYFEKISAPANLRMFVFIGVLGGFTTFSSFSIETLNLFRGGEYRLALINILASNLLAISAVFIGFYLADLLN